MRYGLWLSCGISTLLLSAMFGQTVRQVSATVEQGQTVVQITGEKLPSPSVSLWRNQFLILEFRARFEGRGREVRLTTPHAIKLRYGWYTSNPPRVRVVVTLRGKPPYRVERTETGFRVSIGEAQAATPPEAQPTPQNSVQVASAEPNPPASEWREVKPILPESAVQVRTAAPEPERREVASAPPTATRPPVLVSLDFVGAEIGDVLKALAIQSGANIVTAPDVKGTITVSLNRVSVEEALNLITRLSGYHYERIENTYVVGTPASIEAFRGKPASSERAKAVEVFTFKVAQANEVALYLRARFPDLTITPSSEKDPRYLLVEGDPERIAEARAAAEYFEQQITGGVEIVTEVYRVKYADSRDLVRILAQMVPTVSVALGPDALLSRGTVSGTTQAMASPSGGDAPSPSAQQMGAPMPAGGDSGSSSAQPPNLLVLMGTARDVLRALEILKKVDIKQPQVVIEARVLDVSEGSLKSLGLSWSALQSSAVDTLDRSEGRLPFPSGGTPVPNQQGVQVNKDGSLGIDFSIVKKPIDFSVTLNALAEDRRNRLLANPRVATLDGRPATIFIGDEVNYVKLIQQTPQGANVQTDSVQAGIILSVLPRVHEDGSITLQVKPEVSVITGFLNVPGGGSLPQLARRNAETTIRLNNGETLIIGGLIREQDIKTIQKVPLLGDLPFFGYLFRRSSTTRDRSEIVITLTVRVME
ncbi:MAG: secretin and TonB N-terminal domain-containing protein [Fimbriimonadales bacterium]|mgnify:CR=1 FL=1|jgi:general secretion pathway protein D|nr:secretin and TonB N-terminal domain-containing protein [Fimbriimonadales bacterium]GBC90358.1 Type II secretion system protein D [bacterium HR14]GIV13509.1 MAG: hypothetical protein KatS3mg021_1791 [Fimbriimonadales bacterium]CUU05658.1 Type II secretory pathway component GspD/PulD (secretin) [Armatimonadetes bacterium GBS]CUU36217.1 Type II secretory pathway component GspD/PulD (secretin) [Armatimonadetes bacterium GXS]